MSQHDFTQASAAAELAGIAAECSELLVQLDAHVADHFGVEPGAANWAHVGDANHIRNALRELVDFAIEMP